MDIWMWFSILAFCGGLIFTLIQVFNATSSGDHAVEMGSAITSVTAVNLVLICILAGTGYLYTQQNPTTTEYYMMFMIHLSLLLSVISVSVAALNSVP